MPPLRHARREGCDVDVVVKSKAIQRFVRNRPILQLNVGHEDMICWNYHRGQYHASCSGQLEGLEWLPLTEDILSAP